jgi:RNA polymerase sigma-70 factor (ECF subfamily)
VSGQNGTGNETYRSRIYSGDMGSQEQATRDRIRRFEADVLVHLDDLYRAARRLTRNAAEAQDLTQDTCLRAFERLDQLRSPTAARVWVFTILRSIFLRRVERQTRSADVEIIDSPLLEAGEVLQDTYEALRPIQETPLGDVRAALARLPLPFREPLVLAHVGGFSYKEIAEILAIPLGTVMSRLFRGRRMLRSELREPTRHTRSRS